jgi:DNA-binding winged helix-turn-helix (wHTH) protein
MKQFLPFKFSDVDGVLWRGHARVPLTRKAAGVLTCLIDRAGACVSKRTILDTVWPDTHVQEDNVKVLVREIRAALDDDPRRPTFIRCEASQGYTFIAPVYDLQPVLGDVGQGTHPATVVGRGRELALLMASLEDVRAGLPQIAQITGERGIGKTALCDVFLRVAAATTPLRVSCGRCTLEERDRPLAPFLDVIAQLERQAPALMREVLAACGPSWKDVSRPHPRVEELPAILAGLGRQTPLLVVIEDLQWADEETRHALDLLAADRSSSHWLLLVTCCPQEPVEQDSRFAMSVARLFLSSRTRTLGLRPLTGEQVAQYVEQVAPGSAAALLPELLDTTAGNPGLVVHAVTALTDAGVIGTGGVVEQVDQAVVANVLQIVMRSAFQDQIDRLSPDGRSVLEVASLIGRTFSATEVANAGDLESDDVSRRLQRLATRGHVLRAVGDEFAFRHPLYADLLARSAPVAQQFGAARRLGHQPASRRLA